MVVKVKEKFEKTTQVKKNDNGKKYIYEDKEMQNIMIKFYLIERNLIISLESKLRIEILQKLYWPIF